MLSFVLYPANLLLAGGDAVETPAVSLYKQNYVTIDFEEIDLKFQLSYRIKLAEYSKSWSAFMAHTHKAYWAISSEESAPFKEHNFNPEVHVRWDNPESSLPLKHFQLGVEHESTGVAGPGSRSWNRITGQTEWAFDANDHTTPGHLHAYLRAWWIFDKDEDNNPDIADHLGYGEVGLAYAIHEKWKFGGQVALTFRKKSVMAEYGFKTKKSEYFYYVQYWNGRGEWLMNYKEDTSILRAGIKFDVD